MRVTGLRVVPQTLVGRPPRAPTQAAMGRRLHADYVLFGTVATAR